ncbi:endo-1,5-alpha-L-arabinosidase [Schizopora paradoxa]|uniref:Arabinan endo-1,5-alpha-L-arabinosidase n=1 Tax=Schizopora paradoxa TaxID=27342 RepID=A0A0H2R3F8_9AGAM|nr:endo-1,5-alpha-L-arabinosidase [Schizopora paradoxa]
MKLVRLISSFIFTTALANALLKREAPPPLPIGTFPNPLPTNSGSIHDPSVILRDDGTYFLFSTHNNVSIQTTRDLTGTWVDVGSVLPQGATKMESIPGWDDIWAPNVLSYNGLWYCYYAVSTFGVQDSGIGVATSPTMEPGSWTDHGEVYSSVPGDLFNAIDPFFFDSEGTPHLGFGSFWSNIFYVDLTNDGQSPLAGFTPVQLSFNSTSPQPEEGGFIYKPSGSEYYYLFFSSGTCCGFDKATLASSTPPGDEYKVFVGRSKTATGPYYDAKGVALTDNGGTLVLASHDNVYAPGGQMVFHAEGMDILAYHWLAYDGPLIDATLGLNAIDWSTGWPILTDALEKALVS